MALHVKKLNRNLLFAAALALAALLLASAIPWPQEQPQAAFQDFQIAKERFGRYIEEWSEPEGEFDSDNFISNETSYLHVIDQLHQRVKPGGFYLGVGPDQNFSYIVHTRPMMAVITDIRRQNMLQHLMFKALFEKASNRIEFLALLFSKKSPEVEPAASFEQILRAIRRSESDQKIFQDNLRGIKDLLIQKYKLPLSSDDLARIDYVYGTFYREGLDLRFSSIGRGNAMMYPTFEEILLETDRLGRRQNYLSSEELFHWLKRFQTENRLIPIVGDFAGPRALKALGGFLKQNGLRVSTFYTSNVEFYLFGRSQWTRYMSNVHALPFAEDSVFIRSYFPSYGRFHPLNMPGHRSTSIVSSVARFISDYDAGRMDSYWEVVKP